MKNVLLKSGVIGILWMCCSLAITVRAQPVTNVAPATGPDAGPPADNREATILLDDRPHAGFRSLFNGKDLTGWTGNLVLWSVKDGAIVGESTKENPASRNTFLIWTNGTVGDFELRLEYKIVPGDDKGFGNSGIQYRSRVLDATNWVVGGYQADFECGLKYSGILYDEAGGAGGRGIMAARSEKVTWNAACEKQLTGSLGKPAEIQSAIKLEDWNEYVIIARGNHFQHFINGRPTVEVTDDCEAKRLVTGVLALQLHAGPPMRVSFRNIRLQALDATPRNESPDLRKFQGAWAAVAGEVNGQPLSKEDLEAIVVTIKGNKYTVEDRDGTDHGRFTVNPSKSPMEMDVRPESGDDPDRVIPAIYEFGGDTLRVCYAIRGAMRPSAFKTTADSGFAMFTYKLKPSR